MGKLGKIITEKLPSGRYDYFIQNVIISDLNILNRKNVIYARVSTSTQKENLDRQIERLKLFTSSKGIIINNTYYDIASALNYNRKYYQILLNEIMNGDIENLFIEYKDRLLRFGFEEFEIICKKFKTNIIIIDENVYDKEKNNIKEITEDLIAIIHHFSMKIYSNRKRKKIIELINDDDTDINLNDNN